MVKICALASGSNGNCYYVGNDEEAVLIDMGISNRQLNHRLREAGLALRNIKAIFISHEHTDHIQGMRVTCAKNNIAGYATKKTYERAHTKYRADKINYCEAGDVITIGKIKVHVYAKPHDAVDAVSFRVEIDGKNIGVLTDIGEITDEVSAHFKVCDAAFLESNYEHDILMTGRYPYFLKQRVASDKGHLSNDQALEFVKSLNGSPLKHIFLSHISADNNRVDLAIDKFKELEATHKVYPTSRFGISEVIVVE